jgi:predicted AlkP superfamily pyrophosphatase or phosphodiesterase
MKYILICIIICFCFTSNAQKKMPKIVVGIVVDQMCYDYLYRFQHNYSTKGFKKIMSKGSNCRNVEYNYIPTYTGPGHASIYTGTTPNNHGIVANAWYDRSLKTIVNCVGDSKSSCIGASGSIYGNCSPHRLKTYTLTDQLKMTYPKSKVISISIKDRGAILPGGHKSDGSYWFDYSTGGFITSDYFESSLPIWLQKFNKIKNGYTYAKTWSPLLGKESYSSSDKSKYEVVLPGKANAQFPYDIKDLIIKTANFSAFTISPFANTLLTDLALEAMDKEGMGKGEQTDMLCISYSATDIAGHAFGPYSKEIEDMYIRLDLEIARLLKALDKNYGKNGYVLFLTADHGVVTVPQQLVDEKLPGGYLLLDSVFMALKEMSNKVFHADLIENVSNLNVYLNYERIDSIKGLEKQEVINVFTEELNKISGIKKVVIGGASFNNDDGKWVNLINMGYDSHRSGDLIIVLEPGYLPGNSVDTAIHQGTSHGSGYSYDTHVPLLWYGAGIKKQEIYRPINITDIAATLVHILNLQRIGAMTGNPIVEILQN